MFTQYTILGINIVWNIFLNTIVLIFLQTNNYYYL